MFEAEDNQRESENEGNRGRVESGSTEGRDAKGLLSLGVID